MADPLTKLRRIAARQQRQAAEIAATEHERDEEIRELLAAGERAVEVASAAHLHVQRVYQIRDGRR